MHRVINKVLLSTIICGIVLFFIKTTLVKMDDFVIEMLFVFLFCAFCTFGFTKIIENYKKALENEKRVIIKCVYSSDEARTNAARDRIKMSKIMLPILLFFSTIGYLVAFIIKFYSIIREKALFYTEFTFLIGTTLFVFMFIIVILGIREKERVFASENIRKYAYIYLNILVSLLLIVR